MALYLSKSRTVMHHLKPNFGSLGIMLYQHSGISSFSHQQESQSAKVKNRPTLFTIWRSEHVKAGKQLDCMQNFGEPQVFLHFLLIFFI